MGTHEGDQPGGPLSSRIQVNLPVVREPQERGLGSGAPSHGREDPSSSTSRHNDSRQYHDKRNKNNKNNWRHDHNDRKSYHDSRNNRNNKSRGGNQGQAELDLPPPPWSRPDKTSSVNKKQHQPNRSSNDYTKRESSSNRDYRDTDHEHTNRTKKHDKDDRFSRDQPYKGNSNKQNTSFHNASSSSSSRRQRFQSHDQNGKNYPRKRLASDNNAPGGEGEATLPPIPVTGGANSRPEGNQRTSNNNNNNNNNNHGNKRRKRDSNSNFKRPQHNGRRDRDDAKSRPFNPLTGPNAVVVRVPSPSPPPPPPRKYEPITVRSSPIYHRVLQVGEGTYGKVYKARNVETNVTAALKRLRMESEREGMPITAVREIKLLQSLRHENVVSLREMMIEEGNIYMVFEYMDHDLAGILSHPDLQLSHANIKYLFKQMLEGLAYLHHKAILHRDIKGSNILLDNKGQLKIADFGLARSIDLSNPNAHYTNRVITLWYRPPELLLGATKYSPAIDVWGMGCLLIEMFRRKALFQGTDEISQLACIYSIMGTPTRQTWPEAHSLPWYQILYNSEVSPNVFRKTVEPLAITPSCIDLTENLLSVNPAKRLSAKDSLAHRYFEEDPLPMRLDLHNIGEWHDYEAKRRRRKEREERRKRE